MSAGPGFLNRESPPQARVVIARSAGMLGNRLFLSAYFLAHASVHGYRLFNPALGEYAALFESTWADPWCRYPARAGGSEKTGGSARSRCRLVGAAAAILSRLPGGVAGVRALDIARSHDAADVPYDLNGPEFMSALRQSRCLLVQGWKFRDDAHLKTQHGVIRDYFTPRSAIRARVREIIERARAGVDVLIGVHVRQGDYRAWQGGRFYFDTPLYAAWMRAAAALFPGARVGFLICSNAAQDPAAFAGLRVSFGSGVVVEDLYALAECDRLMGPPSTFSLWASYYGRVPLHMLTRADQAIHPVSFTFHDAA
ncbi:MAG TPA: hypothetical protein VIS74_02855 [Chthoniobacterales bacterium]